MNQNKETHDRSRGFVANKR